MTSFTRAPRRKSARRAAAVGAVAVGALLLAACGGDDMSGMDHGSGSDSESASASASASAEAGSASFSDADVTFAQMMIPHHEQALEMARLADGRASDAEVKDLAGKIEKAQDPEIKTMKGWLESWKQPTATESMPGMDHGGHGGGDGMMSDADMEELKAMKGTEFDKMFADMMIDHHNGAITMAKDEQKNGKNADAVKMAGDIVKGQSAEVTQLRSILDRL
ncbi:DUF305 domain-containing protein [Streptomyces sp. NL15-2K]|uniref:DUF305 domain-containing protein n=1 Tax=Streptomyces sp. NL15-2K TaxID=376149 RepID=UPI000F56F0A6|nr:MULTISPECIES: DUF305 domain-containing protein [Actinomycetes]WKX12570.1 DUF305 domain-containing protein [Kutzneria buriramensis]GCB44008.1 multicopper oxidase [Streptomyces sp. NL15-2K]